MKKYVMCIVLLVCLIPNLIVYAQESSITINEITAIDTGTNANEIAISPLHSYLAIKKLNERLQIWDIDTDESICELPNETHSQLRILTWSSDGEYSSGGFRDGLLVWNVSNCEIVFENNSSRITAIQFVPNEHQLIFSCTDCGQINQVNLITLETNELFSPTPSEINSLEYNSDGSFLVLTSDTQIVAWNTATGETIFQSDDFGNDIAFSPDSDYIAVSGESVQIISTNQGIKTLACAQRLTPTQLEWLDSETLYTVFNTYFPAPSEYTYLGSALHSFDVSNCEVKQSYEILHEVELPISLTEDEIIVSYSDNFVDIKDTITGESEVRQLNFDEPTEIYIVTEEELTTFAIHRELGIVAIGGQSGTIYLIAMKNGAILTSLLGFKTTIHSIYWLSDTRLLGISDNGQIRIWNVLIS